MGKCIGCGRGISTFLGLPAWCTKCAGFTSPIQKGHLDSVAAGVVGAAVSSVGGPVAGAAASAITKGVL